MTKRRRPWIISERTSTPAHLGSQARQLDDESHDAAHLSEGNAGDRGLERGRRPSGAKLCGLGRKGRHHPEPGRYRALEAAAPEQDELAFDRPYIIAVGRLVSVKNYGMLIEAFAKSSLPCRLVIAGDGPERDVLRSLAATLGIAERVIMPGWLSNPYPALAGAAAFALSSNVEGFPNALVEAMALGVPVVATNCPDGPAEILARRGSTRFRS